MSIAFSDILSHRRDLNEYISSLPKKEIIVTTKSEAAKISLFSASSLASVARSIGALAQSLFSTVSTRTTRLLTKTHGIEIVALPIYTWNAAQALYNVARGAPKSSEELIDASLNLAYTASNLLDSAASVMTAVAHFAKVTGNLVVASGVLGHVAAALLLVSFVIDTRTLIKSGQALKHINEIENSEQRKIIKARLIAGIVTTSLHMVATALSVSGIAILIFGAHIAPVGIALVAAGTALSLGLMLADWGADLYMRKKLSQIET